MPADDLVTTFLTAQAAFTERVHAVTPDQWQRGTPDAQWTVADLVGRWRPSTRWLRPSSTGRPPACSTRRSTSAPTHRSSTGWWR